VQRSAGLGGGLDELQDDVAVVEGDADQAGLGQH
jgi:hypothetical protein